MNFKNRKLHKDDKVAILAPSSGNAEKFPTVFSAGITNLENIFGLRTVIYPTALLSDDQLYKNPQLRAQDINKAFADPSIKGIFTAIGGDDCVRILPFLDKTVIRNNPKLFIGYSDTTVLHAYLNQLGLITFHGPSVMAGFAQTQYLPKQFEDHIKAFLFNDLEQYDYSAYPKYCDGYPDWAKKKTAGKINPLKTNDGWHWLNGTKKVRGQLFGGCIEALEFIKSTDYWPNKTFWDNKILFLETSEEKPTPDHFKYMLRNYGTQGIFNQISALLIGRPIFYTTEEKEKLEKIIQDVAFLEFGRKDLNIITNMDFGHTDPQLILPLGMNVEVNPSSKTITLINN